MDFVSETLRTAAARLEPVRLPFVLPGFRRTSWVSDRAREVWEDRVKRAVRAWQTIEFESVWSGLRPAGLLSVRPGDLGRLQLKTRESGLAIRTLARGCRQDGFPLLNTETKDGDQMPLCVAIGQQEAVEQISLAYPHDDPVAVGSALGYPACCCSFFQLQSVQRGYRDTTWPMAAVSHTRTSDDFRDLYCEGPPEANTLWLSLGIQAVPHLPCSFSCAGSVALSRTCLELGQRLCLDKEIEDLMTILSWPAEWSSLYGIAEIKTPILKVITSTDAFAYKHTVRRNGDSYPAEIPVGLAFPYLRPAKNKLSSSPAFRRGLAHEVTLEETKPE
jgi:hypothetical protein